MQLDIIDDWLNQFEFPDRYIAKYLVSKMRYVSFEEFEQWLQEHLEHLLTEINKNGLKEGVAIFPVEKPTVHKFNQDKEIKPANDSSGRIAHSLTNIDRRLGNHIELTPRIESMRARKVRHIIYIDDIIGTGDRFVKFWRNKVSRSVKNWCARGWCKIWIISFAGHKSGISNIVNQIKPAKLEQIRVNLTIENSFISQNRNLLHLTQKYSKSSARNSYGNTLCPIIFQHGCPNNAPDIFWAKYNKPFTPLFPDRSIPKELYPLFTIDNSLTTTAEDVWMAGNYGLAIQLVNRLDDFKGEHNLITILALIANKKPIGKIRNVMIMSASEFQAALDKLTKYGLIDHECKITIFGTDILSRAKKPKKTIAKPYKNKGNFYPATFMGLQREV